MSAETHRLLPTLSPSFFVSSSISIRRPTSTTVKPAFISASDAARPTPVPAPVTSAILLVASGIWFPRPYLVFASVSVLYGGRGIFWFAARGSAAQRERRS